MATVVKSFTLAAGQVKNGGVLLKDYVDDRGVTSRWIPFAIDKTGRTTQVYAYRVVQEFDHD